MLSYGKNLQGLPQESVLEHLLFLKCINEFPLIFDHSCVVFAIVYLYFDTTNNIYSKTLL